MAPANQRSGHGEVVPVPLGGDERMDCARCGEKVAAHLPACQVCGAHAGYPNVRAAQMPQELLGLDLRYDDAKAAAAATGCESVLNDFEAALGQSFAVLVRSLDQVLTLAKSDNALMATFALMVAGGARLPEDNEFDRARQAVDALMFPSYHPEIRFASLSLDGRGAGANYGAYTMVLREAHIELRASAFEENSFEFCRRHGQQVTQPIPRGYRADWPGRRRLAVAKLAGRIKPDVTEDDFPAILVEEDPVSNGVEFVEIHIYGPISRRNIEKVIGPQPVRKDDRVLVSSLQRLLKEVGAGLELR